VYLDYASFAPVDPRVLAVMRPFFEGGIGDPSAPHSLGAEARASLEAARVKVARLCGGAPSGVIFTSGATEANNLAVTGLALAARDPSAVRILLSPLDHASIVNPCRDLERRGATAVFLPVDGEGRVDTGALRAALRTEATLVSIGAASDEIGTLQPLAEIGRITRAAGVPLHVDAVGALGRVPLGVETLGIDLLTVSSNDLYGPPGAGALWVRPDIAVRPQVLGGGQEGGYRAGTENVPALVGFGVAADLARSEAAHGEPARLAALRDQLSRGLLEAIGDCRPTGARDRRLPHHFSMVVRGLKAESVLLDLDLAGIAASCGPPRASSAQPGSAALRAIGCAPDEMEGAVRFTLGRWSAEADVAAVVERLPAIVSRRRALAPLGRR
jgi:cysteine desulfurase